MFGKLSKHGIAFFMGAGDSFLLNSNYLKTIFSEIF